MPNNQTPTPPTHSVSEKGHAKNLETIKKKKAFAAGWGAEYTPTNAILQLDFIAGRIADGEAVTDDLQAARAPYSVAVSVAEDAFEPLGKLMTRLERGFSASGAADSAVDDLKTYTRKVKGSTKKKKAAPDTPADGAPPVEVVEKGHSTSQMSRVNRIENLDAGIAILVEYTFNPNEIDLKPSALQTLSADLKTKTEAVSNAFVPVSNKLNERDEIFYLAADSLYQIDRAFDDYVISRFGTDSPEYNQIRNLEFKKFVRKKDRG